MPSIRRNTATTTRTVFSPSPSGVGVQETEIEFTWYMGMSTEVRRKSIQNLHEKCRSIGFTNVLEASSKSKQKLGIQLSAFFLKNILGYPVENIFQSSKVFKDGGPYRDLLHVPPNTAKKDPRLKNSGPLTEFTLNKIDFPLEPKSLFYDWVYVNVLFSERNTHLRDEFFSSRFDAFSDIEFNPSKSFSCQARTLALCVSLYNNKCIDDFIHNPILFARANSLYDSRMIQPRLL